MHWKVTGALFQFMRFAVQFRPPSQMKFERLTFARDMDELEGY